MDIRDGFLVLRAADTDQTALDGKGRPVADKVQALRTRKVPFDYTVRFSLAAVLAERVAALRRAHG